MTEISEKAYTAATDRYLRACQAVAEIRLAYLRDMGIAEDELEAAAAALTAQELSPGIPAYLMAGNPWDARPNLRPVSDRALEAMEPDQAVDYIAQGRADVQGSDH